MASRKRSHDAVEPQTPPGDPQRRHSHRKTASRVFYGDVMAQEREMERINYEKRGNGAPTQLRKGESPLVDAESAKLKRQKRTEERRSKRQALRRTMSPRSPDGGPQRRTSSIRTGVSMVQLDAEVAQKKRRFARDEDAIQDATLHSTAWRHIRLESAPRNILPDTEGLKKPYALEMDVAMTKYDAELKMKCQVSDEFLKPRLLTVTAGVATEMRDRVQMEDKVWELIEEATPLVKKCHAVRANAVIANTRQQLEVYLEQRPVVRAGMASLLYLSMSHIWRRLLHEDFFETLNMHRTAWRNPITRLGEPSRIIPKASLQEL
ncbi:Histone-lysine N-methyltransferase ezh1 [Phytophthora boehmeriae]|uniref:Histone-lysine N-methyltransferase ezh1 n=1 Tax=Phytophthora boehmeriae TaxID=109152 RepID=A0A8T1WXU8_9STRA|nr:Histone-lysine N-methyltransferase ezh1 [Phytophthora boehmeriae]